MSSYTFYARCYVCDAKDCEQTITLNEGQGVIEADKTARKEHGWQVTGRGDFCPKHKKVSQRRRSQ